MTSWGAENLRSICKKNPNEKKIIACKIEKNTNRIEGEKWRDAKTRLERNTRPEPHKTRRNYTYAMRDTSGASVDVTRVSKSGNGNTAAVWVVNGEATQRATARWVATESIPQ